MASRGQTRRAGHPGERSHKAMSIIAVYKPAPIPCTEGFLRYTREGLFGKSIPDGVYERKVLMPGCEYFAGVSCPWANTVGGRLRCHAVSDIVFQYDSVYWLLVWSIKTIKERCLCLRSRWPGSKTRYAVRGT